MVDVEIRRPVPLRTVPGVELAAVGTWKAKTGETTFTAEDFAQAVAALDCPGVRNPVIKLGHDEEDSGSGIRWDGEPAVGWVANLRLGDDAKLRGDFTGMPAWLADPDGNGLSVLAAAYPDRSIEIYRPFVCQVGHTHPAVITAVSLLGVYAPGVGVLKSMQDVYAAFTQPTGADAKAMLSTTVRLAAPEQREPTPVEKRATTDFEALGETWAEALAGLLEQWPDVATAQRDELSAQITAAVDDNPDRLGDLAVASTTAAALLLAAMTPVAAAAAAEQVAEAARQGVPADPVQPDPAALEAAAAAVAATMAAGTAAFAGRTAAQLLGTGSGADIAEQTAGKLADLGDRFLRDQLGGALSAAQFHGRMSALQVLPGARYYASERADTNACEPCRSIDGTEFDDLDSAVAAYGSGKYAGCLAGARCRGLLVAVWDVAKKASAPITVRTSIGDTMPAAVKASVSVEEISRKYYESAGYSSWITAMHVDPLELIVADDSTGSFHRVSVEVDGKGAFSFGEPQEVAIVYKDVKSAAAALPYRWQDRRAALSAQGVADLPPGVEFAPDGTASLPEPDDAPIAPDVSPAGAAIRKVAAATVTAPDVIPAAGSTTTGKEASGMPVDAAKLRELFDLPAELSDDEVRAAALAALAPPPPSNDDGGHTDPAAVLSAIPAGSDAIVVDREVYTSLTKLAKRGDEAWQAMKRGERDTFLTAACKAGRFPVSRLQAYKDMWDKNPDETRSFVQLMPANSVPVEASGSYGADIDMNEADLAYAAMYPEKVR